MKRSLISSLFETFPLLFMHITKLGVPLFFQSQMRSVMMKLDSVVLASEGTAKVDTASRLMTSGP